MKRTYYPTPAEAAHEARATDFRRASTICATLLLLLSLLSLLLPGCTRPAATAEQRAERMVPADVTPATYTTADGFEAPVRADTTTPAP